MSLCRVNMIGVWKVETDREKNGSGTGSREGWRGGRSKVRIKVEKMEKGIGFGARSYGLIQFVPFGSAVSLLHWR